MNISQTKSLRGKFFYPEANECISKNFQLKYKGKLSITSKLVLQSFQKKYFYYAIDDILYLLNLDLIERDNLLAILYSPALFLQNNFSVNFLDMWIHELYIHNSSKVNKFLKTRTGDSNYITIKFLCKTKTIPKKKEFLW